jgi:hypothetical protein
MTDSTRAKTTVGKEVAGAAIIAGIALAVIGAAVAALVFGAYGCGKLFAHWLPFSPFEATVVSLLALVSAVGLSVKVLSRFFASLRRVSRVERCAVCGEYHDIEDHEDDEETEDLTPNEGLRAALFASGAVKPNAPCPCGSGDRYSKCCGDGRLYRRGRTGAEAGAS